MVGVGAAPEVFDCPEEKENSNTGQVADGLLAFYTALVGGVEVL